MLKFGNKEFRNLQEQVLKNMQNIANIKEGTAVLSEFGIKVVGEVDTLADLPSVADYKAAHEDWEYGDAFAVGTTAPYSLYILTRENDTITADHWFDIGDFPAPGPQGQQGPQGEVGPQGQQGNQGEPGVDAGFGSVLATAQTLPAGSSATATVTSSGPNTAKEFSFTFGIPRGADGGQATWGNIQGTLSDQTDLQDELDDKQDTLVSGTNIKTINNSSILGSGNIEITSGVWGNITGTLSDQTDLKNALDAKQDEIDASHKLSASLVDGLATVATTGAYADLSGTPTIGTGTITIKKNSETIDSFGLNQTADQNINISVPTKVSDLSNDSGYITGVAWGSITGTLANQTDLNTALSGKQDTISDLSTIRSGAEAGATAVQPAAISDMATETWVGQQGYLTSVSWSDVSGKPTFATVATTGDYDDLSNKPTIPTDTSDLTNGAGFQTSADVSSAISTATANMVTTDTAQTISGQKTFSAGLININAGNGTDGYVQLGRGNGNSSGGGRITGHPGNTSTGYLQFDLRNMNTGTSMRVLKFTPADLSVNTNNTVDLGTSSIKWKDLYLSGSLKDGTNSISIANIASKSDLPATVSGVNDGTNWTSLTIGSDTYGIPTVPSNLVTTDTDQTITGIKKAQAMFNFSREDSIDVTYNGKFGARVIANGTYGELWLGPTNASNGYISNSAIVIAGPNADGTGICLYPNSQGSRKDLGKSNRKWKDLYLSGSLIDGTNTLSIATIASGLASIPTNNNQLTNGAGYQTASDVSTAIAAQSNETFTFVLSDNTIVTKTFVLA